MSVMLLIMSLSAHTHGTCKCHFFEALKPLEGNSVLLSFYVLPMVMSVLQKADSSKRRQKKKKKLRIENKQNPVFMDLVCLVFAFLLVAPQI